MSRTLKQRLSAGERTIGAFLQTTSPVAAEILAGSGFDWLIVDLEHAPGDYANLLAQMQAMSGSRSVPFARAPWNDTVAIKRILDTGVVGVLVPYVNTRDEAEAAVAACRYPPQGIRGVAGSPRAAGYGRNAKAYLAAANEQTIVVVAVETGQAVNNLQAILAVGGIDGVFVGPMDLASSMGCLGDPSVPVVQEVIAGVERQVLASGKWLGTVATNWEQARACFDRGYRWLILLQDGMALRAAGDAVVEKFRQEYGVAEPCD
jgi:2-dehydro-3-deoxyglucarate aldolase/4-hydroxy-2-oxoheptanedioate aldolase